MIGKPHLALGLPCGHAKRFQRASWKCLLASISFATTTELRRVFGEEYVIGTTDVGPNVLSPFFQSTYACKGDRRDAWLKLRESSDPEIRPWPNTRPMSQESGLCVVLEVQHD